MKEPYTQLFYDLSQQFKLAVTFGGGISIKNSRPAQLYFGLLDWIRNQYSVAKLCTLLRSGYFKNTEEDAPSPAVVVPLSIGSSNPKPGEIHMTHYQQGLAI